MEMNLEEKRKFILKWIMHSYSKWDGDKSFECRWCGTIWSPKNNIDAHHSSNCLVILLENNGGASLYQD